MTGAGIITSLGCGWDANSEGFRVGRVAIKPVTGFDVTRQRVKVAAEVQVPDFQELNRLSPRRFSRMEKAARMLLVATRQACAQARWEGPARIPIVLGTTSGGMTLGQDFYRCAVSSPHTNRGQAVRVANYQAQRQVSDVAEEFDFQGPVIIIANACASGANAIGHASELIRSGQAESVLTGGYESLSQLVFSGFDSLQALSPTQCRPFDAKRDGLALGEGAAVLTLESLDFAMSRKAEILGEVLGYGASTDIHHLTQPHPQGDAALASMNAACLEASLRPSAINYINAHGTGTPLNDVAEAEAITRWAGASSVDIPVSSTKSSVGHLLGAAGAVEFVVCLMALGGQWLPPTSTLHTPDPKCSFPLVSTPTDAKIEVALTNSFGFGGSNATLIVRRWR